MKKKGQFYLITTVFIVSALVVINSALSSYKETTYKSITLPFSELPYVSRSMESSVRKNIDLSLSYIYENGDIEFLQNVFSKLNTSFYFSGERESSYYIGNLDLGISSLKGDNIDSKLNLGILGPSKIEVGRAETRYMDVESNGVGRYILKLRQGIGQILFERVEVSSPLSETNPYVYIIDSNEDGVHDNDEEVIYINSEYSGGRRPVLDKRYTLGIKNRIYGEDGVVKIKFGELEKEHIFTLNDDQIVYEGNTYEEGEVVELRNGSKIVGLVLIGDAELEYLDYIIVNVQTNVYAEERRKLRFDPYVGEGLKEDTVNIEVKQKGEEYISEGKESIISIMIHNNLIESIQDKDLGNNDREVNGTNEYSDVEGLGLYVTEPVIRRDHRIIEDGPFNAENSYTRRGYFFGDHETEFKIDLGFTEKLQIDGIAGDQLEHFVQNKVLEPGDSIFLLGTEFKLLDIIKNGEDYYINYEKIDPYITVYDGDDLSDKLPLLKKSYTADVNATRIRLDFGDGTHDFYEGDFFIPYQEIMGEKTVEDYLLYVKSFDSDSKGDFVRLIPIYSEANMHEFYDGDVRVWERWDEDFKREIYQLSKYDLTGKKIEIDRGGDGRYDVQISIAEAEVTYDEDCGIIIAPFKVSDHVEEVDQYFLGEDAAYTIGGFPVKLDIIHNPNKPDTIKFSIEYDPTIPNDFETEIKNVREGDTIFIGGIGYKVMDIVNVGGNIHYNSSTIENDWRVFLKRVPCYQFQFLNELYKKKESYTGYNPTIIDEQLYIDNFTSFLDVYKFYPEKEGTYTFFIKYYYWADLNGDGDFSGEEDKEIFMVREKYTFVVI